ncbi:Arrestin C-terminal-like domain-containing protein [Caenorhabditis elegans]|uniref:Arrestin C-terminal-like domain-containing protein n=1 Tax=Caenorhabditis elegans TaxID=6239 RepID=O62274_CAEEL|nr:Arrestin C-terminal-like domain-containing protein [Caenorhabditis elegans]CAB04523.3 Arrestin C-terminal-like domain-containing protein [Caenorhabditis elegans]
MKQKRAIRLLVPDRPLRAGCKELVELSLRIPNAVQILESNAVFEGVCRATFSGQDSQHTLIKEQLHIPFTAIQLPTTKGIDVIPEGHHRLPIFLNVPHHMPGTFNGKFGAIVYRFLIKLKVKRFSSGDEGTIECEKAVDVLGRISLEQQPSFAQPVSIDRHVKKKAFFMNRLEAHIKFEIERAAYSVGDHILVTGEIKNEHLSNPIKHVALELRQHILYASGDAQRSDTRLITRLILGSVPPTETFAVFHSFQVPFDCYPSLVWNGNPVQVTYELLLTNSGCFEIGTPVFLGNYGSPNSTRRSIMYPESTSGEAPPSTTYYCVPPSEMSFTVDPPPYSTFGAKTDPVFIPIHMLKTPYRPFAPAYHMFRNHGPPKYDFNSNQRMMAESPPPQRFLKIEEIE